MRLPTAAALPLLLLATGVPAQEPARAGWVVLPVEDYRALRAKANPPEPEPPPPPVDSALTRVDYELRLTGDAATGEARLSVDVFKEGWVSVAVPEGLLVSSARLDGRPVPLVDGLPGQAGRAPRILLSRTGAALITLDVVVPVRAAAGTESLSLPPAPAALQRAVLQLPRQGLDLSVSGGLLVEFSEAGGQSRCVAAARAGETLAFSWRRKRDDQRATQPLRLRGGVVALVGLSEDGAQLTAEVRLTVVQGQASAVSLALPEGLSVNEVAGPLVADFSAAAGVLKVGFLDPLDGEASFTVSGELRLPREGRLDVPLLRLPEAERESGGVAVEVLGAGEIKASAPRGLDAADATELGGPVAGRDSPSLLAFRYRPQAGRQPRALAVEVARYTPQAVLVANVEEARYRLLLTGDGKRLAQARYGVRNNQRSFLALTLPKGASLWSAAVDGRPVRPGLADSGALLLPLRKGRPGEDAPLSVVEVVYAERAETWQTQGRARLELPGADLPVSRTGLELHTPPRYRVTLDGGPLREAGYAPPLRALADVETPPEPRPESGRGDRKAGAKQEADEFQPLVERFLKDGGVKHASGALPLRVPFPSFGPALFLAAELTAEGAGPGLELAYKRSVK